MFSQPFTFGFNGIDIDDTPQDEVFYQVTHGDTKNVAENELSERSTLPPKRHEIDELLAALPNQIGYNTITVTSINGRSICIPRREIFDIRVQLMAEDDESTPDLLSGLEDSDIRTNVYEGGFKTWECSVDLVKYLLDNGIENPPEGSIDVDHIIELGAGTALPTLALIHQHLTSKSPHSKPLNMTIADYNPTVLIHSILPNILLLYASTLPSTAPPFSASDPNPLASDSFTSHGSLLITPELLSSFKAALTEKINLTLLSGSWSPPTPFLSHIPSSSTGTLILASETIYSPAALASFTSVLAELLERESDGRALVAAKKIYFGVGGGVDEFREEAQKKGLIAKEVELPGGPLGGEGVRRCIVEVKKN